MLLAQLPGGDGRVGLFGAANNLRNLVLLLLALANNVDQALPSNEKGRREEARLSGDRYSERVS